MLLQYLSIEKWVNDANYSYVMFCFNVFAIQLLTGSCFLFLIIIKIIVSDETLYDLWHSFKVFMVVIQRLFWFHGILFLAN